MLFKKLYNNINIDKNVIIKYLISNGTNNSIENFNIADLWDLNSTNFLLQYSLGIKLPTDKNIIIDEDEEDLTVTGDYIDDPEDNNNTDPIIYIYNTHQTEAYEANYLAPYNIKPTVLLASYMLRERLNDLEIPTIVETANIKDLLNSYGWKYGYSYKVSRMLMENAKKNNNSLIYFIDLHRDAGSYKKTTTNINNESYAKVLFVVGTDHENHNENLKLANNINALFERYYPSLSRGVITKGGKGVNGIYNQDFSSNSLLIEVGGEHNTINEVNNTINAFSDILFKFIKGENDEKKEI